jgi:hypothetical protein
MASCAAPQGFLSRRSFHFVLSLAVAENRMPLAPLSRLWAARQFRVIYIFENIRKWSVGRPWAKFRLASGSIATISELLLWNR